MVNVDSLADDQLKNLEFIISYCYMADYLNHKFYNTVFLFIYGQFYSSDPQQIQMSDMIRGIN